MTETAENAQPGDYVCGDCDRIERDPIFLDLETCSKCGELIEAIPDEDPPASGAVPSIRFANRIE